MRRIDVIIIGIVILAGGGLVYFVLQWAGLNTLNAGIWTQALLVLGLIGWMVSYLFRVVTSRMTYHQQLKEYEDAVLQKRLEEMSPEEIAQLQAEVEAEKQAKANQQTTQEKDVSSQQQQ
ncbi:DUF3007 family protein [Geitlerinema sp. PCC 9228]|jgi:hypothetical protein|uniref:DUF3007 family protein n=1 Tax=Geitlerinema sp. PCC 9228 TaxID=111611 RepID=UPI0008F9A97F|nr:DUF3007 family protein [Geitlerinema sp. PCC 9228]